MLFWILLHLKLSNTCKLLDKCITILNHVHARHNRPNGVKWNQTISCRIWNAQMSNPYHFSKLQRRSDDRRIYIYIVPTCTHRLNTRYVDKPWIPAAARKHGRLRNWLGRVRHVSDTSNTLRHTKIVALSISLCPYLVVLYPCPCNIVHQYFTLFQST